MGVCFSFNGLDFGSKAGLALSGESLLAGIGHCKPEWLLGCTGSR
jgi:hypothetical protein